MNLDTLCRRIREMTAINDHGGAYLLAAQQLGLNDLAVRFAIINRRHEELGYLPVALYESRYCAYKELMRKAHSILMSRYDQFYSCF